MVHEICLWAKALVQIAIARIVHKHTCNLKTSGLCIINNTCSNIRVSVIYEQKYLYKRPEFLQRHWFKRSEMCISKDTDQKSCAWAKAQIKRSEFYMSKDTDSNITPVYEQRHRSKDPSFVWAKALIKRSELCMSKGTDQNIRVLYEQRHWSKDPSFVWAKAQIKRSELCMSKGTDQKIRVAYNWAKALV